MIYKSQELEHLISMHNIINVNKRGKFFHMIKPLL